jgi:hypothetical protein
MGIRMATDDCISYFLKGDDVRFQKSMGCAMKPKFPLYIPSKGRWDVRHTSEALHKMGQEHYMIIEAQEYEDYKNSVSSSTELLVLDPIYQEQYDTCDDLGSTKSKGPGAARNFAWDHSIKNGFAWHWVMDDNIKHFKRLNKNKKYRVDDPSIFAAMEDFCLRYENIAMAGPFYESFVPERWKFPPFITNTRIYSCNLIRNDVPYRWRGRYNEDTDLSLRMLKDRWCTVQFYAFMQSKMVTQSVKGGNTKEFYQREGTLAKSKMQVGLHPDVSRLVIKYGRWHHYVDYSGFKQKLKRKENIEIPTGTNDYGMVFQKLDNDKWVNVAVE